MNEPSASIESLLKLAGERDRPSADAMARAREAAMVSWREALAPSSSIRSRRWLRAGPLTVAAAGVVAVVTATVWWQGVPQAAVAVASVAHVEGTARLADPARALEADATLRGGDVLATGAGRVALTLGDTLSLRVDQYSRLRFENDSHVALLKGTIYVDSGGLSRGAELRIETPTGEVRHVGTQFLVQVADEFTRVRVREGRVVMTMKGRPTLDLAAGDLAEVEGEDMRLRRGQPSHGRDWEWVVMSGLGFDIENRPLAEFLAWLAREHGWQLRYASEATSARAQEIRLHGTMEGLDADAMIERVALITGMSVKVQDGVLRAGEAAQ